MHDLRMRPWRMFLKQHTLIRTAIPRTIALKMDYCFDPIFIHYST